MTDLPSLPAILTRLRAATGPDRELDADICVALLGGKITVIKGNRALGHPDAWFWIYPDATKASGEDADLLPALTASIDAAVALVERMLPGWEWSIGAAGEAWASINATVPGDDDPLTDFDSTVIRRAPTPAIALLSATIEALMAREGQ